AMLAISTTFTPRSGPLCSVTDDPDRVNGTASESTLRERDAGRHPVPRRRGHALVAQLVLEDPPNGVLGDFGPELDEAGNGEVGQVVDRPPAQLLLGQRGAGGQHGGELDVVLR